MNSLAIELNKMIEEENEHIYNMLSNLGKEMYYPKGILSQSAEAKKLAKPKYNATIGIATENGGPLHFSHIQNHLTEFSPEDIYPYAPVAGKAPLREAWKDKIVKDNPSLQGKKFGLPIVTNALTHGLSIVGDLFVEPGDAIITPDKYWGNYNLTFGIRRGAKVVKYELFNEALQFNTTGLEEAVMAQKEAGKAIVILNFPNNPTGYTPNEKEVTEIVNVLSEAAKSGIDLIVVLDDAYFGLFYEDSVQESIFGRFIGLHPNLLPIKIDGATKESYVWGLRVGFVTFGVEEEKIAKALEQKTMGLIRGTISNSSHLSQTIVLNSLLSEEYDKEKAEKYEVLKRRAIKVKEILQQEIYKKYWTPYPFNSGYFMCVKLNGVDAEKLRVHLLEKYGVGTIAVNETDLRIAFSSVNLEDLEQLFDYIYKGMEDLV